MSAPPPGAAQVQLAARGCAGVVGLVVLAVLVYAVKTVSRVLSR